MRRDRTTARVEPVQPSLAPDPTMVEIDERWPGRRAALRAHRGFDHQVMVGHLRATGWVPVPARERTTRLN